LGEVSISELLKRFAYLEWVFDLNLQVVSKWDWELDEWIKTSRTTLAAVSL
jgi:hypothetical protein